MSEYTNIPTSYVPAQEAPTTIERAAALGATVPQDHQDAADRTATVVYKGHTFKIDFARWSFEVMDYFERGLGMKAFRIIFEDEQFEAFKAKLNYFDDFEPFLAQIQKARTAGK